MSAGSGEDASNVREEPRANRYEWFEWCHLFGNNAGMPYKCRDLQRRSDVQVSVLQLDYEQVARIWNMF